MASEATQQRRPSRAEYIIGWTLGLVCLVAYLASPNVKMTNGDTFGWARYLEEYASAQGTLFYPTEPKQPGPRASRLSEEQLSRLGTRERTAGWWVLWNPHHLLYLPATGTLFRLVHRIIPALPAIEFLRFCSALAGFGTILLLYRLMVRIIPGSPYPLPWCLLLAFSPTFFRYATDGTQYPVPVFFLAVASGGIWAFALSSRRGILIRAGFWMALAILFHQIVVLIVPFLLLGSLLLIRGMRKRGGEISYRWFWGLALVALGIPILVYLAAAALALIPTGEFTLSGLFKYGTLYARQPAYWTRSVLDGLAINFVTFIGFYFGNARTHRLFLQSAWFTALVMIVPATWITAIAAFRRMPELGRWWLGLCLLWILPLLVFLSIWNPGHEFYHLFLTIPLGCVAVMGAEAVRTSGRRASLDLALFWLWCLIAIGFNLRLALAGSGWIAG